MQEGVGFPKKVTSESNAPDPKWTALWGAFLGFMLDAMDVLLYVFAIHEVRAEFRLSAAHAGLVSSSTLVASSLGGIVAGRLCDRIGRRRTLIYTILLYSAASGGTALSGDLWHLIFWRALVGIGLGGEWSAGAVLVAESWPAHQRGRAISFMQSGWAIGYMLAAGVAAMLLPRFGWRMTFLAGVLPALLTLWIRRSVQEPEVYARGRDAGSFSTIFQGELKRRTLIATGVATAVQMAYWGLFTWLPGFLSAPITAGGAGFDIVKTSGWIVVMQTGAFLGYLTFGWAADRYGRRSAFAFYVTIAAILTPLYGSLPSWAGAWAGTALLIMGPLVGFFGTGYFSMFGATLAELYPTAVRGTGQGFVYNSARGISGISPFLIGAAADRYGIGSALALSSVFFCAAAILVFRLPETRGTQLEDLEIA